MGEFYLVLVVVVGAIFLLAQIRLFTIDTTLRKILDEMKRKDK